MPNIIETLRDTYATDKAAALNMLPELFRQYEDGLIPVLPCKVGDTVFVVTDGKVFDGEAIGYHQHEWRSGFDARVIFDHRKRAGCFDYDVGLFGKTVFLTHSEAEQALKAGEA